jgi:hypothetical protein
VPELRLSAPGFQLLTVVAACGPLDAAFVVQIAVRCVAYATREEIGSSTLSVMCIMLRTVLSSVPEAAPSVARLFAAQAPTLPAYGLRASIEGSVFDPEALTATDRRGLPTLQVVVKADAAYALAHAAELARSVERALGGRRREGGHATARRVLPDADLASHVACADGG